MSTELHPANQSEMIAAILSEVAAESIRLSTLGARVSFDIAGHTTEVTLDIQYGSGDYLGGSRPDRFYIGHFNYGAKRGSYWHSGFEKQLAKCDEFLSKLKFVADYIDEFRPTADEQEG